MSEQKMTGSARFAARMGRLIAALAALALLLSACGGDDGPRRDLTATLTCLQTGEGEAYVYRAPAREDGESSAIARAIAERTAFTVGEIARDGETASASVQLTAPDALLLLREEAEKAASGAETAEGFPSADDAAALLEAVGERLDASVPTKTFDVTVTLRLVGERWYLVPSGALDDAFAGGLLGEYASLGAQAVERLAEEGEG